MLWSFVLVVFIWFLGCFVWFLVGGRDVCAHECRYSWRPERALNPAELKLQMIMFHHMDAGN